MKVLNLKDMHRLTRLGTIRSQISDFLTRTYADNGGLLGNLDRWSQRRIIDENMAKLTLVMESDDPAESCYKDLIREIDSEARSGIYLVRSDSPSRHLKMLCNESGISGTIHRDIPSIAPILFADETAHSTAELDLVWTTIHALHDRAHIDAMVSEMTMGWLLSDANSAQDMSSALRALQYSFHEDAVRRRCNLVTPLSDQEIHDVRIMVGELAKRGGDYRQRIKAIENQASRFFDD